MEKKKRKEAYVYSIATHIGSGATKQGGDGFVVKVFV